MRQVDNTSQDRDRKKLFSKHPQKWKLRKPAPKNAKNLDEIYASIKHKSCAIGDRSNDNKNNN